MNTKPMNSQLVSSNSSQSAPQLKLSSSYSAISNSSPSSYSAIGNHISDMAIYETDQSAKWSPERNSFDLGKLIQSGAVDISELTDDERVNMVRTMRDNGRSIDEISSLLQIDRRTVASDFNVIDKINTRLLMSKNLEELAGEVYNISNLTIQQCFKKEKYAAIPKVLQTMIETLQSMGIVYKAPQKSQVAALVGVASAQAGQRAYNTYQDTIAENRTEVIDVMTKLLIGLQNDTI